jgi:hypothetical protein
MSMLKRNETGDIIDLDPDEEARQPDGAALPVAAPVPKPKRIEEPMTGPEATISQRRNNSGIEDANNRLRRMGRKTHF